jgi:hypothetical protein
VKQLVEWAATSTLKRLISAKAKLNNQKTSQTVHIKNKLAKTQNVDMKLATTRLHPSRVYRGLKAF